MSSAPCPRDLEYSPAVPAELRISVPGVPAVEPVGYSPASPGAGIAPEPALLQAMVLWNHRLCPATYTALLSAATEYSESQPSKAIQSAMTEVWVAGNAAAPSHRPGSGKVLPSH